MLLLVVFSSLVKMLTGDGDLCGSILENGLKITCPSCNVLRIPIELFGVEKEENQYQA